MSDTSNPPKLASAETFDDRLRRTDENRWLATRYAPPGDRVRLVALYCLHQELQRALRAREPMLGKIRLQWWRETLEQAAAGEPARRHDLAEEVAALLRARGDLLAPLMRLIDQFDAVLDDHLGAGHGDSADHVARHLAPEGGLLRAAGLVLDADALEADLERLAEAGEARAAGLAGVGDADARWRSARQALRLLPSALPAVLHLAADAPGQPEASAFARRWRLFRAALTHRL